MADLAQERKWLAGHERGKAQAEARRDALGPPPPQDEPGSRFSDDDADKRGRRFAKGLQPKAGPRGPVELATPTDASGVELPGDDVDDAG